MKRIKDILIGILIGCMIMMTTPVLADSIIQKIDVVFNSVQVQVNGENVNVDNILYNGSTYLPVRKVAEVVGKDIEWNGETKTANIIEKKVSDNMTDEFTIVQEESGISIIAEKNGETYYTINYALKLMQKYGNYTFSNNGGNISFILFEDGTIIVENIPYILDKGILLITKAYYENTILPLINK